MWSITTQEAAGFVAVTPVKWPAGGPRTPGSLAPVGGGPGQLAPGTGMPTTGVPGLTTPPARGGAAHGGTYKK